jgi:cysteine-rich repeat protein
VTIPAGVALKVAGGGGGGSAVVVSHSTLRLAGSVDATAGSSGAGGDVTLEGCAVLVDGTVDVEPSGALAAGMIAITAAALTVGPTGRLLADPPLEPVPGFLSTNAFTLRAGEPVVAASALIRQPYETHLAPLITPCCGNGIPDPDETCDDGNRTSCDGCDAGCNPEPPCPDDGNPCTTDCDPAAGCVYRPRTDTPCPADADACTADVCAFGTCVHPPLQCDDGIACTLDACVPATGCVSTPDHAACDDGNGCTTDICDGADGCTHADRPDQTPCDDGDLCTTADACLSGQCVPTGIPLECDDGDPCTVGECLPVAGCVQHEDPGACGCTTATGPSPAGTPCADGNACTRPDACDGAGHCVGGPVCDDGDACTTDVCFFVCLHVDDACSTHVRGPARQYALQRRRRGTVGACQGGSCVRAPRQCGDTDACEDRLLPRGPRRRRAIRRPATMLLRRRSTRSPATRRAPRRHGGVRRGLKPARHRRLRRVPADVQPGGPACPATTARTHSPSSTTTTSPPTRRASSGAPRFTRVRGLVIENHLGTLTVDAIARRLFVPAAMSLGTPPGEPAPEPDAFFAAVSGRRASSVEDVPVLDRFGVAAST